MNRLVSWINGLPAHQAALLGACIAAVVGAITNILTGLIRDFAAKAWSDQRAGQRAADEIFRSYAEPLGSATTSLYWRLKEIFGRDGRASFLAAVEPRTDFDEYKLRSTYFRLAAVLGWLRALRRELSFLRNYGEKRVRAIDSAIHLFEKALADGHHVEIQCLQGLLSLWQLPHISDNSTELRVAVAVEHCVKYAIRDAHVVTVTELDQGSMEHLCSNVSATISTMANFQNVPQLVLAETQSLAIRQMAIREAWLYRDWQASIGDMMIRETTIGNRHFEVLGYGDFEEVLLNPSKAQGRSLCRIAALLAELDMDRQDPYDARPAVIRKLFEAVAQTIVALADTPASQSVVDPNTADDARRLLSDPRPVA